MVGTIATWVPLLLSIIVASIEFDVRELPAPLIMSFGAVIIRATPAAAGHDEASSIELCIMTPPAAAVPTPDPARAATGGACDCVHGAETAAEETCVMVLLPADDATNTVRQSLCKMSENEERRSFIAQLLGNVGGDSIVVVAVGFTVVVVAGGGGETTTGRPSNEEEGCLFAAAAAAAAGNGGGDGTVVGTAQTKSPMKQ